MESVCVPCRWGAREMARIGSILHALWVGVRGWLWRILDLLLSNRTTLEWLRRPALPDPEEGGNTGPSDGAVTERQEDAGPADSGGQSEAGGLKRAAAFSGQNASKRPKTEEEYGVDSTDEFDCEYDSTWEDDSEEKVRKKARPSRNYRSSKFRNFERAAADMQNFRHGYPNQSRHMHWSRNADDDMPNLNFYLGKMASKPDGVYITKFHSEWMRDYERLEYVHTFIQWLFPLQEPGVNYQAKPMTKDEVEKFCGSDKAKDNLLTSYKLMLDFYGIELCDEETGEVKRAENWRERFNNLNCHTHNNLRITRILKCLGTLGFERYQVPLVKFFLEETLINGELPRVKESVLSYFMFAVLNKENRKKLIEFAYLNYHDSDEFVWCPMKIQKAWKQK